MRLPDAPGRAEIYCDDLYRFSVFTAALAAGGRAECLVDRLRARRTLDHAAVPAAPTTTALRRRILRSIGAPIGDAPLWFDRSAHRCRGVAALCPGERHRIERGYRDREPLARRWRLP